MKRWLKAGVWSAIFTVLVAGVLWYLFLPALNVKSVGTWMFVITILVVFGLSYEILGLCFGIGDQGKNYGYVSGRHPLKEGGSGYRFGIYVLVIAAVAGITMTVIGFFSGTFFHAKKYANILKVEEDCDFQEDLVETLSTDAIAIMDTNSARMLGNRKLGSLSSLVSQYNVSDSYSQINYQGTPVKVATLDYAGFFKYVKNRKTGIPGYVLVSPVDMSAQYVDLEQNMKYVPSGHFSDKLIRHIRFGYPTAMIRDIWFEIDEEGAPYFVASVYDNTIGLFGGTDIVGSIVVNPVSGHMNYYKVEDVPEWVDIVYDGDLLCEQYDYYGKLRNGYWNSKFSAEGCKVTTSDYGYIAMDNDIWVYTGVTSVNSDASNIGFMLMNERTKESKFYTIAGADEYSAMTAAQGEVQQYGYVASFPSLINVDGNATYIMVLKDSGGLVKMYAAGNAEQYNMVTTASDQKECIEKYRRMMKTGDPEASVDEETGAAESVGNAENAGNATGTSNATEGTLQPQPMIDPSLYEDKTVVVSQLKEIVVDGNTMLYLLTEDGEFYHAKYTDVLEMMKVQPGDTVDIKVYEDMFLLK